jgi:uncharacterized membrane protein YtjA (UPF0391 family)
MTTPHRPRIERWTTALTRAVAAQWAVGAVLILVDAVRGAGGDAGTSLPIALVLFGVAVVIVALELRARARSYRAKRALVGVLTLLTMWAVAGLLVGERDEAFGLRGAMGDAVAVTWAAVHALALTGTALRSGE